MTREELKKHCQKQIENCEMWAKHNGEEPHGKIYEEHKLILELLEQEPILDKIRAEIDKARFIDKDTKLCKNANASGLEVALQIIDKYNAESEE